MADQESTPDGAAVVALEDLTLICQMVGLKLAQSGLSDYLAAKERLTGFIVAHRTESQTELARLRAEVLRLEGCTEQLCELLCKAAPLAWVAGNDMAGAQEWEREAHGALNRAGYAGEAGATDEQLAAAVNTISCMLGNAIGSPAWLTIVAALARKGTNADR